MIHTLTNIALIGEELALAFDDGTELYLSLPYLRRACPCANCQGEPDALGRVVRPQREYSEKSFVLKSHQVIGSYAIQFTWADGHSTGIYSFEYLHSLQTTML